MTELAARQTSPTETRAIAAARNMNIQPTLTTRSGLPVHIIVNRDLVLRPYQPLFFNKGVFTMSATKKTAAWAAAEDRNC
ncbi:hypothetical protein CKA81_08690 [Pollutimonas thiosulfatoxidans]|uniref:Uncharacterized protein n=1 Tax=Pollutimonas thiosulfatoxidans TaxID=2028345 RepID=A0A410GC95_9BURK|nr:hypothetical protein CKA81_08690 [Pollutimonas thiosulfatoxidans]